MKVHAMTDWSGRMIIDKGHGNTTHALSEVGGVEFGVNLVLQRVIHTITLPHQVVMPAENCGVHFSHVYGMNRLDMSNLIKHNFTPLTEP